MKRREFLKGAAAVAGAATVARPAIAQGTTEISFYYPVAVGGPITKLVDTMAADFEKDNPSIKVKPIYAGTYQETLVKLITAHKSGNVPALSVVLSTDMFTLIDDDAIVALRRLRKKRRRQEVAAELFPRLHGKQSDRRQDLGCAIPALHRGALLEQGPVQGGWPRSRESARQLGRATCLRAKADQSRCVGRGHAMGHPGALDGFSLLAVPGFFHPGRRHPHEPGRQPHLLRQARGDRGPDLLGGAVAQAQGAPRRHRRVGHHAQGLLREEDRHDVDHHRQSHQRAQQRQVSVRRCHASGRQAARQPHRGRQLLYLQEGAASPAGGGVSFRPLGHYARARGAVVRRHRLRRSTQGCVRYPCAQEVRGGLSRCRSGARPARIRGGRTFDPREPAGDQGAERRVAGGSHRHQDAGAGHEGRARRKPSVSSCAIANRNPNPLPRRGRGPGTENAPCAA